jgi:hypothetical protein
MKVYTVQNNEFFDLSVSLDGSKLSIEATYPAFEGADPAVDAPIVLSKLFDLEAMRQMPDFSDHAYYAFFAEKDGARSSSSINKSITNLYALTVSSKVDLHKYKASVMQMFPLGVIYVPFAESPISEWAIGFRLSEQCNLTLGPGLEREEGITLPTTGETLIYPEVKFLSNQATVLQNGTVELPFKLVDAFGADITNYNADVYLEATAGYLTARRVKTSGGQGVVQFRPDGMTTGDKSKVKCGFKFFSGTDDCFVTVQ